MEANIYPASMCHTTKLIIARALLTAAIFASTANYAAILRRPSGEKNL